MSYFVSSHDLSKVQLNQADNVAATLQEVAVVLSTRQGSIPLYRRFGLPMRFVDMPFNAGIPVMVAEVMAALDEFVPQVEVIEITTDEVDAAKGKLSPVVEVRIRNEES